MSYYEYRHRVGFEETNVVGNVYFTHYLRWQGRCREMFLHQHAPELMPELGRGLALATTRVACSYYRELAPLDEVAVRMSAAAMTLSRLTMTFQYFRLGPGGEEELVAEGEQEVACMHRADDRMEPASLPQALRDAVDLYMRPSAMSATNLVVTL
jgi:enediyne core biosynthesis thioesterase